MIRIIDFVIDLKRENMFFRFLIGVEFEVDVGYLREVFFLGGVLRDVVFEGVLDGFFGYFDENVWIFKWKVVNDGFDGDSVWWVDLGEVS